MSYTLPTADNRWSVCRADAADWLRGLPDDSLDLLFTSPPYEQARTYGLEERMPAGQAWVDWMVAVVRAASPKVKGLIAIVCEGQTRDYRYSCAPFLLIADLHRAGFNLRKPAVFERDGIPGSGGPDWLKNRWEPIVCITRLGRLPWSEPTACGRPPKYGPGGVPSHRVANGTRVNQKKVAELVATEGITQREAARRVGLPFKGTTSGTDDDGFVNANTYVPPDIANPGNVIDCGPAGGGQLGHSLAHENEAPFPLKLADFFVRSFCPPGGVVGDCFMGSGTTGHAALDAGRLFCGCDVRQSQVDLTVRRLTSGITPDLFAGAG